MGESVRQEASWSHFHPYIGSRKRAGSCTANSRMLEQLIDHSLLCQLAVGGRFCHQRMKEIKKAMKEKCLA